MKNLRKILTLLGIALSTIAMAQPNIGVSDATVNPAPIINPTGISVSFNTFNIGNQDINYTGQAANGVVRITVSLSGLQPASNFSMTNDISVYSFGSTTNNSGVTFTFDYEPITKVFTVTLASAWPTYVTSGMPVIKISNLVSTITSTPANPLNGLNVNVVVPAPYNSSTSNDNTNQYTYAAAALPLSLISFSAEERNCGQVDLEWNTQSELNMAQYAIEYSQFGDEFKPIAHRAAKNLKSSTAYTATVNQEDIIGYYRLKMIDKDGSISYSSVVKVKLNCERQQITIFPNPASDVLNVNSLTGTESIKIITMDGRIVMDLKAVEGNNAINISTLASGNYNVIVTKGTVDTTFRMVKN